MTVDDALAALRARNVPGRAEASRAYHKVDRAYLGVTNPDINDLVKSWRRQMSVGARVDLAAGLWRTDIFEARLAAAKLLDQKNIQPDAAVWALIAGWVADFDSWAIADHACMAGMKRLQAVPARIDEVEEWTRRDHMWARRAALVITLPCARPKQPSQADLAIRERVLGWAAGYVEDPEWFIQKAVGWWLREVSKQDKARVSEFLDRYGDAMKPFARREATRYL